MVEKIKEQKDALLKRLEQVINEKGPERMNVQEAGMLSDQIKDLAEAEKACWEAEYFRSIAEGMDAYGYEGMGYDQSDSNGGISSGGGRSGYERRGYEQGGYGYRRSGRGSANQYGGSRRGYRMGHQDAIESLRMEMQEADPQRRQQLMQEIRQMTEGVM
jgi:hypothetical protein